MFLNLVNFKIGGLQLPEFLSELLSQFMYLTGTFNQYLPCLKCLSRLILSRILLEKHCVFCAHADSF